MAEKSLMRKVLDLEPLMTRGSVVAVLGVVGVILNKQFVDGTAEYVLNIILGGFGLLTAIATRPAVTPNKKVIQYQAEPYGRTNVIEPGGAQDNL
jgi:hypothetical protein